MAEPCLQNNPIILAASQAEGALEALREMRALKQACEGLFADLAATRRCSSLLAALHAALVQGVGVSADAQPDKQALVEKVCALVSRCAHRDIESGALGMRRSDGPASPSPIVPDPPALHCSCAAASLGAQSA